MCKVKITGLLMISTTSNLQNVYTVRFNILDGELFKTIDVLFSMLPCFISAGQQICDVRVNHYVVENSLKDDTSSNEWFYRS